MGDAAIALLAALAGFITALWVLLLWVGEGATPSGAENQLDPILGLPDRVGIYESGGPFIPMPAHLTTNAEMVDWMTKELPALTERLLREVPQGMFPPHFPDIRGKGRG
jgi:hypothetical protein